MKSLSHVSSPSASQAGNVIFYILIAVTLLAALSFAVSQSGRGSVSQLSEEKARLYATEIIEFGNTMASGVAQLRLRGVALSDVCFDHARWGASDYNHAGCTDNTHRLFHPDGAGLVWAQAPAEAMDSAATPDDLWHIYADNEIKNIGTTTGNASGADLIVLVDELSLSVCRQINDMLGLSASGATPPVDTLYGTTRYTGTFSYTATIGDEDAVLDGKLSGCFQKTTAPAKYAFYKVLQAR